MNKKFSTLMASLLLAGGVLSNANAETIANAASDTEQYYYVFVDGRASQAPITDPTGPTTGTSAVLDSDASSFCSNEKNTSTWWTVQTVKETVNGQDVIIGYRLINVKTGEPLSVTVKEAEKDVTYDVLQENAGALVFVDGKYYNGSNSNFGTSTEGSFWRYSLVPVPNFALTKEELDEQNGDSFSIQIGYQEDKNQDGKNEWYEYESYEGENVFAGKLYVGEGDVTTGYALYKDAKLTQRIVLTTDKWEVTSSQLGSGYKFDVLTNAEYDAEVDKGADSKILADQFIVSAPATVQGDPIEVVAVNKKQNASYGTNNFELVVSVVKNAAGQNVNRLTVADALTSNTADYTKADGGNTYVKFGQSNLIDMTTFIGKIWNIEKDGQIASPDCNAATDFVPTSQVAKSYPEGQWLWNNETQEFVNRESGKPLTITGLREDDNANDYVYETADGETYTFTVAGTPGETTLGYLNGYTDDQLKYNAFVIGSPIAATKDTVYLANGENGVLTFTDDKAEAVQFNLTIKAQNSDKNIKNGQIRTIYTAWKDQNAGTTEQKTDIVNFYEYTVAEAMTGKKLYYNTTEQCYVLALEEDVEEAVKDGILQETGEFLFKNKKADTYNIVMGIETALSSDSKYSATVQNAFCVDAAQKIYAAFNVSKLVKAESAYKFVENDQFVISPALALQYRGDFSNTGALDTVKIFRNDDPSYVLYEKGTLLADAKGEAIEGFLGMENVLDPQYATKQPAMLADTAKHANTYRPQYMFAVDTKVVPAGKICPICGEEDCAHAVATRGYLEGRYLVTLADSAKAAKEAGVKDAANKFKHEGFYRLGFVQAKHMGDSLIIASGTAAQDTIDLAKGHDLPCTFALKYVDENRDAFTIETMYEKAYNTYDEYTPADNEIGYIKYQNGVPVVTSEATEAWVFDLEVLSGEENAPTANENIAAGKVVVAGTNGAVVVKGAEGKNVIVSTILGKVVANEVVSSDNATIAAPQGVVVVSVDGESFKVVVK